MDMVMVMDIMDSHNGVLVHNIHDHNHVHSFRRYVHIRIRGQLGHNHVQHIPNVHSHSKHQPQPQQQARHQQTSCHSGVQVRVHNILGQHHVHSIHDHNHGQHTHGHHGHIHSGHSRH